MLCIRPAVCIDTPMLCIRPAYNLTLTITRPYANFSSLLFIFRLHKLGIEAHAYAHYTSLLCFVLYGCRA